MQLRDGWPVRPAGGTFEALAVTVELVPAVSEQDPGRPPPRGSRACPVEELT
ncbi:hypothetical protein RH858_14195 [Halalkaliarchaeum sp. AArc-GB]|uniref:hypothetical protein n=1 Tax=Halalkaliarchaeum sp. AArc-GB TaxID=3074078 RepID=UPI00286633D9|nr:hypothetical protein [Halalkaliarchaeum sp. AArc-GB]MDR5674276.1 hypothetical protein [Halalkaliarchaeum sp. AArc-GB]